MLQKNEETINNAQDRKKQATLSIQETRRRQTKQKHYTTICVGHHCTQTNTNNENKTSALLLTTIIFVYLY